jgi:uncharacterized membrane protein (DUF106 family)
MALFDFMNVVLILPPAAAIFVVSLIVAIITTLVYKYTTDQKKNKEIKDKINAMKAESRAEKDPAKSAQAQKEMMKMSMGQFNSSIKSMMITMIPLLLLFLWMQGHLAYAQVLPGQEIDTTMFLEEGTTGTAELSADEGIEILTDSQQEITGDKVKWDIKGDSIGTYQLQYQLNDEVYTREVIVTEKFKYANPVISKSNGMFGFLSTNEVLKKGSPINKIEIALPPLRPFGNLEIFGYMPGWLATYILFSLIMSMLFRKLLKVY